MGVLSLRCFVASQPTSSQVRATPIVNSGPVSPYYLRIRVRELQAVTDHADEDQWCCATQAGDALRELNQLVNAALTVNGTLDIDPAALADAVDRYCSAVLLGAEVTRLPPESSITFMECRWRIGHMKVAPDEMAHSPSKMG